MILVLSGCRLEFLFNSILYHEIMLFKFFTPCNRNSHNGKPWKILNICVRNPLKICVGVGFSNKYDFSSWHCFCIYTYFFSVVVVDNTQIYCALVFDKKKIGKSVITWALPYNFLAWISNDFGEKLALSNDKIMTLSLFRVAPRREHLECVKRVHGYL